MDDFNIHNTTWEEHFQHIKMVLHHLKEVNLKLSPYKRVFSTKNIIFLGHVVGKARTKPNPDKTKVVVEFPILRIITNVQTFLGLTGYYKNYINGYARIIIPLFELTKRDVTFEWTLEGQKAFDQLKQAFIFTPILARPYFCKGFFMDVD